MTPSQRASIEALIGTALSPDKLDEINPMVAIRNDAAIAAALSVGRTRLQSVSVGVGTILGAFAGVGGKFLDLLSSIGEQDRDVYWLLSSNLMRGDFDIGMESSRAGMTKLRELIPTIEPDPSLAKQYQSGIDLLLALAVYPDPITVNQVSEALNNG